MNSSKCLVLALLLMADAAVTQAENFRTDINPALIYYQALLLEHSADLNLNHRDYLTTNEWRGRTLDKRFGELASSYNREFEYTRRAARAKVPCDWGIDLTTGPDTLLPHLGRFKAVATMARLRAMWDLQNGDEAAARDDLLAAFALGHNLSRDGILISVLVQLAIENIVCATIAENFSRFSPETLQQLVDGMDAAPARGKAAAAILTGEEPGFSGWLAERARDLRKEYAGNEAQVLQGLREKLVQMGGGEGGETSGRELADRVIQAGGGTSDGVLNLVQELHPVYAQVAAIMALPCQQFEGQAKEFREVIQKSPNPLVPLLVPAVLKAQTKEFTILVKLAMVRAAVEYKLHGQQGLMSVADPCGQSPFTMERFVFEGVDRGFKLTSAYRPGDPLETIIFVETDGAPFYVDGMKVGQAVAQTYPKN
jgi:hypothetical protein